jgi:hypothetical protein
MDCTPSKSGSGDGIFAEAFRILDDGPRCIGPRHSDLGSLVAPYRFASEVSRASKPLAI